MEERFSQGRRDALAKPGRFLYTCNQARPSEAEVQWVMEEELNDLTAPAYQSRLFHHVGSWERLEPLGEHIYLPENRYVAMPGDVCRFCYLVMEGQVISQEMTEDGNEHIFNLFEQGSIFLESNVLAGFHVDIHFITTRPTELVRIRPDVLKKAMREDPLIADTVFLSNASKYYSAMDQLRECYNHSAIWKIYNMFVLLAESAGKPYAGGWIMIDMKITQQFISNMLGINRITVNRALKELRESGRILFINNAYYCVPAPENDM